MELRLRERDIPSFIETGVIMRMPMAHDADVVFPSSFDRHSRPRTRYGRLLDNMRSYKLVMKRLSTKNARLKKVSERIIKKVKLYEKNHEKTKQKICSYRRKYGKTKGLHPGFYKFRTMYFSDNDERSTKEEAIDK